MTVRQKTFKNGSIELLNFCKELESKGFKELEFFEHRVPNGTNEKVCINIRGWCGNWSGWQTFKNQVVYYK